MLLYCGYRTVGEVVDAPDEDLLAIYMFGTRGMDDVRLLRRRVADDEHRLDGAA